MSARTVVSPVPLSRQRLAGRAPKLLLLGLAAALCLAGLRAAIAPPASTVSVVERRGGGDRAAEAFAEAFARAYLSWDAARPEEHERSVARFVSESLDAGAGFVPPGRGGERVAWTAAVQSASGADRSRLVTVAVQTTGRLAYLAVPVARDSRGFLFVSGYPALVGGPPVTTRAIAREEDEVEGAHLRAVAERAVRNYLAGEVQNLRADLDPAAVVSLPPEPLELLAIDDVTWARRGVVACLVSARDPRGGELRLRYELHVVRRDRWYVRSIAGDPRGGGSR